MAKFGLFVGNVEQAQQTYDGERMVPRGEYVDIIVGSGTNRKVVATIKLDAGQSVKEIPAK